MAKFVRIQTCEQGNTHDELINIEDISRIALGKLFVPKMIEEQDIVFNQNSNYKKQKKQEKKNPIFKRNKPKK